MLRRLIVVAAAVGGLLGLSMSPLATPAKADTTHIYSPVAPGLLRVCIVSVSLDTGACIHV
jgi:hypothetical protein